MPPTPVNAVKAGDGPRRARAEEILQAKGHEIEQAAIEIKISEMKHRLIDEPASIIGDDQFGIALLHFLVVGDGIVAKRESDQNDKHRKEHGRGPMVSAAITSRQRRNKPVR